MFVNKQRDVFAITPGEQIQYTFLTTNQGNGVATNAYLVDIIPDDTDLVNVLTTGTANNGSAINCEGCEVYFAGAGNPDLPATLSPSTPFDKGDIISEFTLGVNTA